MAVNDASSFGSLEYLFTIYLFGSSIFASNISLEEYESS